MSVRSCESELYGGSCTRSEFLSKAAIRKIVLVVGVIVSREDARASQSVVMLLPYCANPSIAKLFRGVLPNTKPHSK